jgi:flagellar motor switch protein FliN
MVNIETNISTKFFENFTDSVVRIFSQKFDAEVFDNVDFSINSVYALSGVDKLKGNNVLYKFDYVVEGTKGHFLVLIPEEFVFITSDLLTGGSAKNLYEGNLTEAEINLALGLFNSVLDDIKNTFSLLYGKDLVISSEPALIAKDSPKYNKEFNNSDFDFSISYNLKLGSDRGFLISAVTNAFVVNQILKILNLLGSPAVQTAGQNFSREFSNLPDIRQIADIKISIDAELGRIKIPLKQVLSLTNGSIIELDTHNNSDIKVFANGLEVAKAQVVVVDEHFGIKITKIISPEERYKDI